MPCLSISPSRVSWTSTRRWLKSFQTCPPNTFESPSVASMATCSLSAILPCMKLSRLARHHAMARRRLSVRVKQKSGGARRDRTADLLHAMQALSQLSYGPDPFVCRGGNARSVRRPASRRTSCLFFLLDGLTDDVGHIGIAFFLFLDECGVVGTGLDLDFLNLAGRTSRRLLALLLGLGILKRNEFGIGGLGYYRFRLRHRSRRGPRDRRCRFGPRARLRRHDARDYLAGIGRNHRRLAEIVELAAGFRTDALGAEFCFRHCQFPRNDR